MVFVVTAVVAIVVVVVVIVIIIVVVVVVVVVVIVVSRTCSTSSNTWGWIPTEKSSSQKQSAQMVCPSRWWLPVVSSLPTSSGAEIFCWPIRDQVCEHISLHRTHYAPFLSLNRNEFKSELELIPQKGYWYCDLGDLIPAALASIHLLKNISKKNSHFGCKKERPQWSCVGLV